MSNNYYPGGMQMPSRNAQGDYRYGFQGQEKDNEVKGEGNSINYKFRMHDPRVGRFFATDPLEKDYPMLTPYQFSSLNPIGLIELEGKEGITGMNLSGIPTTTAITPQTSKQLQAEVEAVKTNDNVIQGIQVTGVTLSGMGYISSIIPHPVTQVISKPLIVIGEGLDIIGTGLEVNKRLKNGDKSGAIKTGVISVVSNRLGTVIKGAKGITKVDNAILQNVNGFGGSATSSGVSSKELDKEGTPLKPRGFDGNQPIELNAPVVPETIPNDIVGERSKSVFRVEGVPVNFDED